LKEERFFLALDALECELRRRAVESEDIIESVNRRDLGDGEGHQDTNAQQENSGEGEEGHHNEVTQHRTEILVDHFV